ncbi:hypothetical protein FRC01_002961 [Tulasnella sp. 417]|nr:hypothetical protein FRC01_002961 [Tulasnella sp. 417]
MATAPPLRAEATSLPNTTEPLSNAPVKLPRDIYAFYSQRILEEHLVEKLPAEGGRPIPMLTSVSVDEANAATAKDKIRRIPFGPGPVIPQRPVAILGAGVGGLYAAMILESLGIPFDILEATGRTGGRLFTYKFYNGDSHDYYLCDRYPDADKNPSMKRLFMLFNCRQLNPPNGPKLADKLLDYKFNCNDAFRYYNGVRTKISDTTNTFRFQETGVDSKFLRLGGEKVLEDYVLNDFVDDLLDDLNTGGHKGWDKLMKFDNYSTRGYMTLVKGIDAVTVDWVETVTYGTGWFDKALAELVLEYIAFSSYLKNPKYKCIDGGSRVLPDFMTKYINEKRPKALQLGKRITEIYYAAPGEATSLLTPVRIKVEGENNYREYGHVISTLPLPVLRSLSIDDAGLDVKQTNALRQLQYGPSEKIGVKFKTQWWRTGKQVTGEPLNIIGGQSFSDRVVRTVVYPSFGIPGNPPESTVLIASYSWTEDALRLGAMISAGGALKNQVKELVLRDLTRIHNVSYEFLLEQYEDHFGWDWTHDPLTQGAFAFFGPGEFSTIYKSLTRSAAGGRLHFAGEALSTRHAWVVGALDSAWRAVKEVLWLSYPSLLKKFESEWGNNEDWIITKSLKGRINLPDMEGWGEGEVERDLIFLQLVAHLDEKFPIGGLPVETRSSA